MKKLLSLILSIMLVFSIVPTNLLSINVFAAEKNPYITIEPGIDGKSFYHGDKITISAKLHNFDDDGWSADNYYIVIKDSRGTMYTFENGYFDASKGAQLTFTYDSSIFAEGKYFVYYYSDKVTTNENKTTIDFTVKAPKGVSYNHVITGTQEGVKNNSKAPQSAWITTKLNNNALPFGKDQFYQIRLEELYNDSYANAIAYREYFYADNLKKNQNWIIMKFWVKNLSKKSLDIDDIIDVTSFYNAPGGKEIFSWMEGRCIDVFTGDFSGKGAREVTINPGKSGYFYIGILVDKKYAYPSIKLKNGYNKKGYNTDAAYTWLTTDVKTLKKEKGVTYYYVNGKKSKETTLVYNNGAWYYIKNGVLNKSDTLVKYNGTFYHVKNGKKVKDTAIVKYNGAFYYVKNGVLDKSDTLCKYNGKYYHVKGGKVVKDTTLVKYNNKYYYVKNGVMTKVNTLVKYGGKWYHVQSGVKSNYTGLFKYGSTWYYIKNGAKNSANTLVKYKNKWYHVNGGKMVKEKSTKYVANASSKTFHKSSCYHAKKISASNKYASDRNTMIKLGFKKCKTCKP